MQYSVSTYKTNLYSTTPQVPGLILDHLLEHHFLNTGVWLTRDIVSYWWIIAWDILKAVWNSKTRSKWSMCSSGEIADWQKGKHQTGLQHLNIEILENHSFNHLSSVQNEDYCKYFGLSWRIKIQTWNNSNDYPYWKKKITEQITMYLPFIPIITSPEAGVEPAVQSKFHTEKRVKMKSGSAFSWL